MESQLSSAQIPEPLNWEQTKPLSLSVSEFQGDFFMHQQMPSVTCRVLLSIKVVDVQCLRGCGLQVISK